MLFRWRKLTSDKFSLMKETDHTGDPDHIAGFDGVLIPNSVNNFEMIDMKAPKQQSIPLPGSLPQPHDDDDDLLFLDGVPPPRPKSLKPPPVPTRKSKYEIMMSHITAPTSDTSSDDLIGIPLDSKKSTTCTTGESHGAGCGIVSDSRDVFEPRIKPIPAPIATVFEPIMFVYKHSGNPRFEGFIDKDGVAVGFGTEFTDTPHLRPAYRGEFQNGLYHGKGEAYDTKTNLRQTVGTFENGRIKNGHIYIIKEMSIKIKTIIDGICREEHVVVGERMMELLARLTIN
jgi:hypothetical protein